MRSSDGIVDRVMAFCNEVTDQVRARREVEALAEAAQESERRYRRIFEGAGVSIWEEDFTAVKRAVEGLRSEGVRDFRRYFAEHPDFVERCIASVTVREVNEESLRMFGAASKQQLSQSLADVFDAQTREVFVGELLAIAEGQTRFEAEAVVKTLRGERLHTLVSINFPPLDESFASVLVSLTDITPRKAAEDALREEMRVREVLGQVGAALAAELDSDKVAQAVTDAATTLTTAELGVFFYNVTDESGDAILRCAVSGASKDAFANVPKPLATDVFGPVFQSEGVVRLDDVTGRRGALSPHDVRTRARAELSGRAGALESGGGARRPLLRSLATRRVHRTTRATGDGDCILGRGRAGQRAPVPRGSGGQPREGRIPRDVVP